MKVYIILEPDWEGYWIKGVYSSKEIAEEELEKFDNWDGVLYIEEFEVDQ